MYPNVKAFSKVIIIVLYVPSYSDGMIMALGTPLLYSNALPGSSITMISGESI